MAPIADAESPHAPDLGFSISHQKVELDINLLSRSLRGKTEITVNPHSKDLKAIRINCRQCEIRSLTVNGKPCAGLKYDDPYNRTTLPFRAGVHHYFMLQEKLGGQLRNPPDRELTVKLGKNIKIDELDPFSEEAQSILVSRTIGSNRREIGDSSAIDLTQGSRTGIEQTARFTPITLVIEYEIKRVRDGMHFVGWEEEDLRYPHAYSTNSLSPGAACCLFPCLDELTSRCTWEISIKCAKIIEDSVQKFSETKSLLSTNGLKGLPCGNHGVPGTFERPNNFSNEDKALELVVVCTGDMTDEIVDPRDPTKKTTFFVCTTPISSQHVGFTIGPFEHVDLAEFRESDENDRLGQNAVSVHGFCLPGRVEDLKNTCLPLAKAIDYFTMTYGSYPFSSYKLCFIDDVYPDILHTGSLSICNNHLLFPEEIIEPLDKVSRQLAHALASQWIGVNIVPRTPEDTWVIVGIAYYMTDTFMKKLSGNNEYRYNQKITSDRVVELDVDRPSLLDTGPLIGFDPSELEFIELKAPLVLSILDRRLTKGGNSTGLSRIISRIFLNAKLGDLLNGALDTPDFMRVCEKLGHAKLDVFFAQWVEGAGCPKFRIQQRFNKKKLVVEMSIHQIQGENVPERDLEPDTFMRDVREDRKHVYAGSIQPVFTGPMTIRIHEADGTPYEHMIEIKEGMTRFDVPYNTKYKRLKRSRRQKERSVANTGIEYAGDGTDDILLYSLGDVLQSEEEVKLWRLQEWGPEEEEKMGQESYEWIRMDADFEWICKISLQMPGYMWVSQLQQDKDVVAQLESIQHLATQNGHPLISTICVRTLMDQRYFHGIRTAAAATLTKSARAEMNWVGLFHLEKVFQELFCYANSPMTRPNDFSDRTSYLIQCAIPRAIAKIRDDSGRATLAVGTFLLEKLKFNDNSNNEFSDCHYLATLMRALAEAVSSKPAPTAQEFSNDFDDMMDDNGDDLVFHNACLEEIDRYRRIDEWIPSYQNILSRTALDCKRILAKTGSAPANPSEFLQYTPDGTSSLLRINAFANLMDIGMAKSPPILRYFLFVLGTDPSPYIRTHLLQILGKALGAIAIGETAISNPSAAAVATQQSTLIIEQESTTATRQATLARTRTVSGALEALKADLASNNTLKSAVWTAITSPTLSIRHVGRLLELCDILYEPENSMLLVLPYPRYWSCTNLGKGQVRFSRTKRVRTTPAPKISPPFLHPSPIKREYTSTSLGGAMSAPAHPPPQRTLLKPPKKPSPAPPRPAPASISASDIRVESANATPGAEGEAAKPKLKLKFRMGSGAGMGGGGGSQ